MFESLFSKRGNTVAVEQPVSLDSARRGPVSTAPAPGSEINYYPDLITRFQGHHASLLKLFAAIRSQAMNDQYTEALKSLHSFRQVLTAHLLEENVKLYTYLSKCLVNDPGSKELMIGMRTEMVKIGSTVVRFVNGYINAGITRFNKRQFLEELDKIGKVLNERLEHEETSLYTLYMPPSAFL